MPKFDESEQKIITRLILKQEYTESISAYILPARYFPSGYDYFNFVNFSKELTPAIDTSVSTLDDVYVYIVHNNFINGLGPKINRFQRYNLWFPSCNNIPLQSPINSNNNIDIIIDKIGHTSNEGNNLSPIVADTWNSYFSNIYKNISLPVITTILPMHNTIYNSGNFLAQVIKILQNAYFNNYWCFDINSTKCSTSEYQQQRSLTLMYRYPSLWVQSGFSLILATARRTVIITIIIISIVIMVTAVIFKQILVWI